MIAHLARALQEEAIKVLRHETGRDPDCTDFETEGYKPYEVPFSVTFQLKTLGPKGITTYSITITEANSL